MLETTPDVVGWIKDAREPISDGLGCVMDDVDWIRVIAELISDELGNTMVDVGNEEL